MKTSKEILKEIESKKQQITNKAELKYNLYYTELTTALKDKGIAKYKEMKNSEKLKKLEAEWLKEVEFNTYIKIQLEILKDNYTHATFSENIGKICKIWNSYIGKPHGEKTQQKIRDEIEKATGIRARIYSQYEYLHIDFYNQQIFGFFGYKGFTAGAIFENDSPRQNCIDANNKVLKIDPSKIKLFYIGEYVENVEEHASEIIKLHQQAKQAEKAFTEAISKYNTATRGKMQQASKYDGIKNFIIQ